jgi:hypothetical protein
MNISRELEMSLANDYQSIKSVEVTYSNGDTISGFVKSATFMPLEIVLCKHQTIKGENPYHHLDFAEAVNITLVYHNGNTKTYEAD